LIQTDRKSGGIGDLNYPVSDIKKEISVAYNVLDPEAGVALRGLFIIDKDGIIQHSTINNLSLVATLMKRYGRCKRFSTFRLTLMKSAQLVGNRETRQWFPIQSSQSLLCICIDLDIYLYLRQILFNGSIS